MNIVKNSRGFTILELLVVIAIIGITASIILVATGSARDKGGDAGVKSNLGTVRSQSEIFYSNNTNSYLPSGGVTLPISTCPTPYNASGANMMVRDRPIFDAIAEATKRGNGNSCYNSSIKWAVAVGLKSNPNLSWCVDSGGAAKQVNSVPASAIHTTNFVCN